MQHKSAEKYDFNSNPLPPEGGCAHPRWWRGPSPQSKLSRRMHSFFKGCDIRLLYIARERERGREREREIYIYIHTYTYREKEREREIYIYIHVYITPILCW